MGCFAKPATRLDLRRRLLSKSLSRKLRQSFISRRFESIADTDILLSAYPKSGSTFMRFAWASASKGEPIRTLKELKTFSPPLGLPAQQVGVLPCLVKTHDVPQTSSNHLVYLIRDPVDVCSSYFRHLVLTGEWRGSEEDFVRRFLAGGLDAYGTWATHVRSLQKRLDVGANLDVISYFDLVEDFESVLSSLRLPQDVDWRSVDWNAAAEGSSRENMRRIADLSLGLHGEPFVGAATSRAGRQTLGDDLADRIQTAWSDEIDLAKGWGCL
jgi:hypothetical protein